MKSKGRGLKRQVTIGILFSLFLAVPVTAQESGRLLRGMKGNLELDLFTQVTSRRVVEEIGPGEDFEGDADSTRVMMRLGVKPFSPLELYIQGGAANLRVDEFNDYRGGYSLAWGGGFNIRLYESPGISRFRLAAFGDALTFTTDDKIMTTIEGGDVLVEEEIEWLEYTLGSMGIWRYGNRELYFGVRFSWLDSTDKIKDPRVGDINLEEDDNLGMLFGLDVYFDPEEKMALNIEASLLDQASLKIGLKLWY